MLHPLSICLPLILAVVLMVSGIAKLRHPDDLSGWEEMGVPRALRQGWLLTLHPWAEIALGLAVALLGRWPGLAAGVIATGLMGVYTVLVARAVRGPEDTSCACFGARKAVTRATVVRNVWLLALAILATFSTWWTPWIGGALSRAAMSGAWGWVLGLVAAAVTTWSVTRDGPTSEPDSGVKESESEELEDLDYVRTRTPAIPLTLADGQVRTLRELSFRTPVLILAVSDTCGACHEVLPRLPGYRELLPEVEIRLLLASSPDRTPLTEAAEPQSLHDPHGYVAETLDGMWGIPAAVLLGADGMLAGGPVVGPDEIDAFIRQMRAELDSARA
ncbi:MauE/DoxX family redox-associated membrane protein [Acidipropionibacterium acidipropionici]|uniref:MauE/DoxX family redox-associated membrane protein n=1 Tax=Acidipropionibacterium acidipropionici TaxID=1748 RepID=UPI00110C0124|nr:MauE/DoxX family redox-associated membrane protein [Acidipropionibacterium acidipropionici]QCV96064.1 hypothetical protein FEZ30_13080 [Acidipropionibacterium acidipropionici]